MLRSFFRFRMNYLNPGLWSEAAAAALNALPSIVGHDKFIGIQACAMSAWRRRIRLPLDVLHSNVEFETPAIQAELLAMAIHSAGRGESKRFLGPNRPASKPLSKS